MAFASSCTAGPPASSPGTSAPALALSPAASYAPPDTPKLNSQRREAENSGKMPEKSPTSQVSTVTKNLENMGFGSPA